MPMDDDQIEGLLVREIRSARANDDTAAAKQRRDALSYYNGDISADLPAEVGRSSVVSRDLSDTVGWVLPQLLRVFLATEQIVIAEPVGAEDDDMARQATDGLNYVFFKDNPGYRLLRDAMWNALVLKNGVLKAWHDDTVDYATSFHTGLSDEDIAQLEADPDVEITNQTTEQAELPVGFDDVGNVVTAPVNVHEVKLRRVKSRGRRRIECIPNEDYLRSDDPPGTERPRFEGHRSYKTRSELIEMGFDRKTVEDLGEATDDSLEQDARNHGYRPPHNIADKSMETIQVIEAYMQVDVDGDGLAETIRAYYAGKEEGGALLDWEVWEDEGPFFLIPCEPIPHQVNGRSLADETMDIMRVKSVLWRQHLDSSYAANNPQRFVTGKIINPDELFSPSFGGAIFGEPGAKVENLSIEYVGDQALQALTYADEIVQRRTGVGRQTMALDPEALQNQTATANQNNKDAAYTQVEQIARDMAEIGLKPFFRALMKLEIKHQDRARQIRLGKRTVTIDPRSWNADMDVTINVGLGTGSRDRDLMMLNQVFGAQIAMAERLGNIPSPAAKAKSIEFISKVRKTAVQMAESSGLRSPDEYYPEVSDEELAAIKQDLAQAAQQPTPEQIKEQAKVAAQAESERIKAEGNAFKERVQAEADVQVETLKAQLTDALQKIKDGIDRYKIDREMDFRERELAQQRELELLKIGMSEVEVGGEGGESQKKPADATTALLAELIQRGQQSTQQSISALEKALTAPMVIERDANGRTIGARKVLN